MTVREYDLVSSDERSRKKTEKAERCMDYIDDAYMCVRLSNRLEEYYTHGHWGNCGEHWGKFWDCMKVREAAAAAAASSPPPLPLSRSFPSYLPYYLVFWVLNLLSSYQLVQRKGPGLTGSPSRATDRSDSAETPLTAERVATVVRSVTSASRLDKNKGQEPYDGPNQLGRHGSYYDHHKSREECQAAWLDRFGHLEMHSSPPPELAPTEMVLGPWEYTKFLYNNWFGTGGGQPPKESART